MAYVKKRYKEALKRFPTSAGLRIRYAFFALEIMQSSEEAMKQLHKAQDCNPALDEDFVIFRYNRILQEQLAEYKHQGDAVGMDRVSIIAYDNYYRQCKKKMNEAARLQMEFWGELSMQSPDVFVLMRHGGKINDTICEIDEYWHLMQGLNSNMPKAIRRYARFQKEVLNQAENAKELLKSIKRYNYVRRDTTQDSKRDLGKNDSTPYVNVSGEVESLGVIKSVNKAFCRIAGYDQGQLVGYNVSKLMPKIVGDKHDEILREAHQSPEESLLVQKETLIPMRLGNGYIMMIYLQIRALPSFANDMSYIVTFKIDRAAEAKQICYLIADAEFFLVGMSESTHFLSRNP